jgi:1-acyl-sn-glycerol-3-phosphate acyltransferase
MPPAIAALVYEFLYWAFYFLLLIGFSFRVAGRRNVPRRGPALLIANHQSFLDPPAVGVAAPRHLHYLARKTLFKKGGFGTLLETVNSVPIDQEGVGKEGMKNILARLEAGNAVLVFPEGERCADGQIHPLRPGIGLLVKRTRAPIVPVGIAGAFDAWPRSRKLPWLSPLFLLPTRRTVAVVFGTPRDPSTLDGLSREQMLSALYDDLTAVAKQAEALRRK